MSTPSSPEMARLLDAIERFGFAVPYCRVCDRLHYPPQSWCPHCLAPGIDFRPDTGRAIVLSTIAVHRTLDARWESRLPAHVACVITDSGLKVFAMADVDVATDTPVTLLLRDGLLHLRVVPADR